MSAVRRPHQLFFGFLFLVSGPFPAGPLHAQLPQGPARFKLEFATNAVGKYRKIEAFFRFSGSYTNPFDPDEVQVDLHLTSPSGVRQTLPAFCYQGYERKDLGTGSQSRDWLYPAGAPQWTARFAPGEIGSYTAIGTVKDKHGLRASAPTTFKCLPSTSHGFLRVSQTDSRFLEFSDGKPFFAIGQNLAFIGSQQYVTLPRAEGIFDKLSENGANYLRIWACCDDWAMAIESRKSAWGRSWDWHPPIVPSPGVVPESSKCLVLTPKAAVLKMDPSHPVALRPKTRYVLSGRLRAEHAASVTLESTQLDGARSLVAPQSDNWSPFRIEFETGEAFWLEPMTFHLRGEGTAWISDLSLHESAGGPELLWEADVNRPKRGFYNPLDSFILDEVLARAERDGLHIQLCLLTRNLYMDDLKNPSSPAYEQAITDAKKLFRYAIARWGYSTSIAAWEYWNEMNPGLPTEHFYSALGQYLHDADCYHHLRMTSTWAPSAKDCRHPQLDVADVHFYLRPSDKARLGNEVEAVLDRTRWLREQAPNKPAHLGEFGIADEKWGPTREMQQSSELADFHNALWASAMSGASGTALFWWWERLDQRNAYPHYRPLARFLAGVPWTTGHLQAATLESSDSRLRLIGLQSDRQAWIWIFCREASWNNLVVDRRSAPSVSRAQVRMRDLPDGKYRISWQDTRSGDLIRRDQRASAAGTLILDAPDFDRDIACSIEPGPE